MPRSKKPRKKAPVTGGRHSRTASDRLDSISKCITENCVRPTESRVSEWISEGYKYCVIQYYTTNMPQANVVPVGQLLGFIDGEVRVDYVKYERIPIQSLELSYLSTGGLGPSALLPRVEYMEGNYLRVVYLYKSKQKDFDGIGEKAAALFKLFHGEKFAEYLHYQVELDLISDSYTRSSSGRIVYPSDSQLANDFDAAWENHEFSVILSPNTLQMLEDAHLHVETSSYFVYLWLAIEAQLGNGQKRIQFCLEELKSEPINGELNRLRKRREDFFHEGKSFRMSEADRYSMFSIIRLSIIKPGPVRDRLVSILEARLHASP